MKRVILSVLLTVATILLVAGFVYALLIVDGFAKIVWTIFFVAFAFVIFATISWAIFQVWMVVLE
jgi:hypothetical protein